MNAKDQLTVHRFVKLGAVRTQQYIPLSVMLALSHFIVLAWTPAIHLPRSGELERWACIDNTKAKPCNASCLLPDESFNVNRNVGFPRKF